MNTHVSPKSVNHANPVNTAASMQAANKMAWEKAAMTTKQNAAAAHKPPKWTGEKAADYSACQAYIAWFHQNGFYQLCNTSDVNKLVNDSHLNIPSTNFNDIVYPEMTLIAKWDAKFHGAFSKANGYIANVVKNFYNMKAILHGKNRYANYQKAMGDAKWLISNGFAPLGNYYSDPHGLAVQLFNAHAFMLNGKAYNVLKDIIAIDKSYGGSFSKQNSFLRHFVTNGNWLPKVQQIQVYSAQETVKTDAQNLIATFNEMNLAIISFLPATANADVNSYLQLATNGFAAQLGKFKYYQAALQQLSDDIKYAYSVGGTKNSINLALNKNNMGARGNYDYTMENGQISPAHTFTGALAGEFRVFLKSGTEFYTKLANGLKTVQQNKADADAASRIQSILSWASFAIGSMSNITYGLATLAGGAEKALAYGLNLGGAGFSQANSTIGAVKNGLGSASISSGLQNLNQTLIAQSANVSKYFSFLGKESAADFKNYVLAMDHAIVQIGRAAGTMQGTTLCSFVKKTVYGDRGPGITIYQEILQDGSVVAYHSVPKSFYDRIHKKTYGDVSKVNDGDQGPDIPGYLYTEWRIVNSSNETQWELVGYKN